jgi:hypothetical protein
MDFSKRVSWFGFILTILTLFACGGGGDSSTSATRVGLGQSIVVYRSAPSLPNLKDLYLIKENGGGLVTLDNSPSDERYAGVSSSGQIIYTKSVIDTYDVYECPTLICIFQGTYSVTHNVLHSIKSDGTSRLAFADIPDYTTFYVAPGVVPAPYTVSHRFIAITANDRVIYSNHNNLLSRFPDETSGNLLSDAFENAHGVSLGNRIIYSYGGDLYSVNEDGTGQLVLADTTDNEVFEYLTAPGEVLYTRETNGQLDLYRVMEDGTNPQLIATAVCAVIDENCSIQIKGFTSGGRVSYEKDFFSARWSNEIYSVKIDGSETPILLHACDLDYFNCEVSAITDTGRIIITADEPNTRGDATDIYSYAEDGSDAGSAIVISANPLTIENYAGLTSSGHIIFGQEEPITGPNGKVIYDLYTIDENGLNLQPLSTVPGKNESFEGFSHSGKLL